MTLLPYNTPILPLRVYDCASPSEATHPASRLLTHRRRVCIALGASERVPRVLFRASARPKGAPTPAVRACIMRGRTVRGVTRRRRHGKPFKRSLVCRVASRWRQVKRSLCMACIGLVWRGVMRRVVFARWRVCVGAVCAPVRHALAVCMCVRTHAPQTSCA